MLSLLPCHHQHRWGGSGGRAWRPVSALRIETSFSDQCEVMPTKFFISFKKANLDPKFGAYRWSACHKPIYELQFLWLLWRFLLQHGLSSFFPRPSLYKNELHNTCSYLMYPFQVVHLLCSSDYHYTRYVLNVKAIQAQIVHKEMCY